MFATDVVDVIGKNLFSIQNRQWDVPQLRQLLEAILPEQMTVEAFDLTLDAGDLGRREMVLNARKIMGRPEDEERILIAVEDVTAQKFAQRAILDREARLGAILERRSRGDPDN